MYTSKRCLTLQFWKKLWMCWRSKQISKLTLKLWDKSSEEYTSLIHYTYCLLKKLLHILHWAFPLTYFPLVCKSSNNLLTTASCVRDATVWNTAGIIRDSSTFNSISFSAENVVLGIAGGRSHKIISLLNKKIGLVSYTQKGNKTKHWVKAIYCWIINYFLSWVTCLDNNLKSTFRNWMHKHLLLKSKKSSKQHIMGKYLKIP